MNGMTLLVIITVTSLLFFISMQSAFAQGQQWVTYENPDFGISIQHPSDWEVISSNMDATPPPEGMSANTVEFGRIDPSGESNSVESFLVPPESGPSRDAHLTIRMQIAESYLDTDTMQLKNQTLENFVAGKEQEVLGLSIPTGEVDLLVRKIRDNYTTIGGIPAWTIETITSALGQERSYSVDTLLMKDNHLYVLGFSTNTLKVPETLPVVKKMVDSFRITTPTQPPLIVPNTADPSQQLGMPLSNGSDDLGQDKSEREVNPVSGLPETLIANDKISGDIRMPLRTAIINGMVTNMDLSKSFVGKLSDRNPNLVFKFANQPQASYMTTLLTGPIKAYDSSEGILEEARYWENMTLNREIPLEMAQVGSNYLIASVQFPGDIWGIYSTVLDVQAKQAMDTKPTQNRDGDNLSHGIDNSSISNQAIQQALSFIICSDLENYGFHVCRQ